MLSRLVTHLKYMQLSREFEARFNIPMIVDPKIPVDSALKMELIARMQESLRTGRLPESEKTMVGLVKTGQILF